MIVNDVLIDFYTTYWQQVQATLAEMPNSAMAWAPQSDMHCVAVLGWHLARSLDLLAVRLLKGEDSGAELWHADGWREQTGYDPTGIGYGGFGNLAGYAPDDVDAIPLLTSAEISSYFNAAYDQLISYLRNTTAADLQKTSADLQHLNQTKYEWLRNFLNDGRETVGTIKTMRVMWQHHQERLLR